MTPITSRRLCLIPSIVCYNAVHSPGPLNTAFLNCISFRSPRAGKHSVKYCTPDHTSWSECGHLLLRLDGKKNKPASPSLLVPFVKNSRRWILSTLQLFSCSKKGCYVPLSVSHTRHSVAGRRESTWRTSETVCGFSLTLTHSRSPVAVAACCIGSEMKADLRVSYQTHGSSKQAREGELEVKHGLISKLKSSPEVIQNHIWQQLRKCDTWRRGLVFIAEPAVICFRAGRGSKLWTVTSGFWSKLVSRPAGGMGKDSCRVIARGKGAMWRRICFQRCSSSLNIPAYLVALDKPSPAKEQK